MDLMYSIKEGFSGIGRAKVPAAITMVIGFFSLVLLGLFGTVSLSFYDLIQEVRSRVEMEVFFSEATGDSQASVLTEQMRHIPGVSGVSYVSKEAAAVRFARDFGEDVVGILGVNPLPRSAKLSILPAYADSDGIDRIRRKISSLDYGLDIRYNQEHLLTLERNARLFTMLTAGIGAVIAIATIVMNAYTVRLAMYARREKIKTMRLVGATRGFISAPFLIEGAVQGLVSGGLAALGIWLMFEQALLRYEPGMYQVLHPSALIIYPGLALLGLLLGMFGSSLSVGRFLRRD
ncbi:MAG: ABC transporter permease [Chlorobiaceae bacterium]|nr:ABC transporter permease [Chlorobiaceae bacterium]NTW73974.1 ABC transporter permease [Chlorobiaceae bacterium]